MVNYREILRLTAEGNNSIRDIKNAVHCSADSISQTLKAAKEKGVSWPLPEDVTNEELRELLFPEKHASIPIYVMPNFEQIHRDLAKTGVNLTLLHEEYTNACLAGDETPYRYTQFCEKYRRWARIKKATMRIEHKPGDKMEVDWAGDTLPIRDPVTGDEEKAYLFVAALPCSFYTYAELCSDMRQENWLQCHVHAYEYYGGITRLLIPDNLKTGVVNNTRYEITLNRAYQDLAEYYGTAIVPCRVKSPNDKSHAEGSVRYAETWILASLRDRVFFSFEEAAAAVAEKLEELNRRELKSRKGWSRKRSFQEEERDFLRPLPTRRYEMTIYTPEQKVGYDYLVTDGINKYSVPFDLIGEKVTLRLTGKTVEVLYDGNRVATHIRKMAAQREPIVKAEHMPEAHRQYMKYSADEFRLWSQKVGPNTEQAVEYFLTMGKEPEQGYKFCGSLSNLGKKYGPARLEAACEKLLQITGKPDIRTLSSMLKNGQDKAKPVKAEAPPTPSGASTGITRGADYYRRLMGGDAEC